MGLGKTSGGNPLGFSCSGWQAWHLTCFLLDRFPLQTRFDVLLCDFISVHWHSLIHPSIHLFVHVCSFSCQKSWCASGMFARCLLFLKLREQWEQREQNREPKRNDLDLDQKFPINFQPFACAGHRHLLGWLWASAGGYCSYRSYPSLEIGSGAGVHHAEGFQWQCLRSSGGQLTFFTCRSFQLLWTVVSSILNPSSILQTFVRGISLQSRMFWKKWGDSSE